MAEVQEQIGIGIDILAGPAEAQAARIKAALMGITQIGRGTGAANDNLAGTFGRVGSSMQTTTGSGNVLSQTFGTLRQTGTALAGQLGALNGAVTGMAFAGASAGALALAGGLVAVTKAASSYQDVLAKISTNVDTTTFSMDALSAGILKQSQAFGQSPAAQAEAAYDIISAGAGSAAEAIDILTSANKLAVGGITTVGVAADGLTSVINAYGSANLSSAQATDAMFIAARDGKTTIDQLAASLGGVAPLAASVGVSFDEVNGAIGVLTKGGIKTAESVTGLKAILSSITKPSKEAADAAKSIGLEFNVAGLRAKGLRGFLEEVAEKTGHSSAKMATLFGGVEALVPALALTGKGAGDFAKTMDSMAHKAGTTEAAVKKMMDGSPSVQAGRVVSNFTVELTKLGQGIATMAVPAMKFLADNMETIFRIASSAAIGLAAFGVAAAGMKIAGVVGEVIRLNMALGASGPIAALFSAGMKMAQGAVNGLTASLMANPFTFLAAALTTTMVLLYQFRDSITLGNGSLTTLGDLGRAVFESLGPAMTAVSETASRVFSAIGGFFSSAFSGITAVFTTVFGDLDLSFSGVLIGAARVADGVIGLFRGSFYAIGAIWDNLPAVLGTNIMAILNGAKSIIVGVGNAATTVFNAVTSFGRSVAATFGAIFNSVATFIENWANKAITAINGVIGGANKLGAGLAPLATVTIGKIAAPTPDEKAFQAAGTKVKNAFMSGFGNEAESGVRNLLGRADAIGKKRRGAAGSAGTGTGVAAAPKINDSGFAEKADGKKGGAKQRETDAEKRLKQEQEFWKTLEGELATAKLLPLAAEDYKKQLDLQKILGRDINDAEKTRLSSLMSQVRTAKFLTDSLDDHNKKSLDMAGQEELFKKRLAGMTDEQLEVEKTMLDYRNGALKAGVDTMSEGYKVAEAQARADAIRLGTINKQNAALAAGVNTAKEFSAAYGDFTKLQDINKKRSDLDVAYNGGNNGQGITEQVYKQTLEGLNRATKDVGNRFYDDFANTISSLGDQFGGTMGKVVSSFGRLLQGMTNAAKGDFSQSGPLGAVISMFNKNKDGTNTPFATAAEGGAQNFMEKAFKSDTWTKPFKSMSSSFSDLKSTFTDKGFTAGIGKAAGQAAAGAQIGAMTNQVLAPLGKALGFKTSSTGAQVGGAIGSIGGPVGSLVGSIVGSIGVGLLKKTKKASATIALNADGSLGVGSLTGNSKNLKAGANDAATSVIAGLEQIASQLGATLSGSPSVSIGMRKKDYRVDTTGSGKTKGNGVIDFNDDAEAAVKYAIQDALKDGLLSGISDFSQRVLKTMDVDKALTLASSYEAILKDLAAFENPIKGVVESTVKSLDTLAKQMTAAGASTTELANVEKWRSMKLDEVLKDQVSSFQSLLDSLNGEAGGFSALTQLTKDMGAFDKFKADLASGKTVDQEAFTTLAGNILDNAGDLYGANTAQYQDIVKSLREATGSAIGNVTAEFNKAAGTPTQTAAIEQQTAAYTANQVSMIDLLKAIADNTGMTASTPANTKTAPGATNGRIASVY